MTPRKPGKHALAFLFITVLISMIGMGVILPVIPTLVQELTGLEKSAAAPYGGYLLLAYAVMQFFMSPILGGLSDRFGRRPVILMSLAAYSFDYGLMAFAPTFAWLFLGRILAGGFAATYSTSMAFITDISTPEERAGRFGMVGAAFGLGFIIGPALGGWLGEHSTRLPFLVASGLAAINTVYGFFVLPETLPPERRRKFSWARANPVGSLLQVSKYPMVLGVLFAYFLMQFAHNALPAVWAWFSEAKFGWTPMDIGWSLAFVGVTSAIVQGGLTSKVIPKIGEAKAAMIGISALTLAFTGYALFTPSGAYVYMWIIVGAIGGFTMPAMQGLMTRAAPADAQGELQGAISSVMSISMAISPLIMTQVFSKFTAPDAKVYFPGAPLLLGAMILACSLVPLYITVRNVRAKEAPAE